MLTTVVVVVVVVVVVYFIKILNGGCFYIEYWKHINCNAFDNSFWIDCFDDLELPLHNKFHFFSSTFKDLFVLS